MAYVQRATESPEGAAARAALRASPAAARAAAELAAEPPNLFSVGPGSPAADMGAVLGQVLESCGAGARRRRHKLMPFLAALHDRISEY